MMVKKINRSITIAWQMALILLCACVQGIEFDIPPPQYQTVIEGMITDNPGPYTVKLSRGLSLKSDSSFHDPIQHANVKLFDDLGNEEAFTEADPGVYVTGGVIQGQVGHSYHIRVETDDGKVIESEPDMIHPVGEVEQIGFEYEARTAQASFGEITADVFKIFVDARAVEAQESFVRWRFTGTYKVQTYPEQHWIWSQGFVLPDPYPCSGWGFTGTPVMQKLGECTCCICWAHHYEPEPQLSDGQLISNHEYKHVKLAEVPISTATFNEKYMVEVEQMSLTRNAFEFFKIIRSQKEGATSLFQPPSGELRGNVRALNSSDPVIGLFWASSVKSKHIFIYRSDVPYLLPPIDAVREKCTWYPNSSNVQPPNWE